MVLDLNRPQAFRQRARAIVAPFGVGDDILERVIDAYTEHWRTYHNHQHILDMLERADELTMSDAARVELYLLIVYHDVWYKIMLEPGLNERMSACWAIEDVLGQESAGWHRAQKRLARLLKQGIGATVDHTLSAVDKEFHDIVGTLIDLDLAGLGKSPESFLVDTERVWREYEPVCIRSQFDEGRRLWAKEFLNRRKIFHTEVFAELEQQARRNLALLAFPPS